MNLPRIRLSKPSFSLRFFIYFLFGLAILILATEGGYYLWIKQKTKESERRNPPFLSHKGVFTYVKLPDGSTERVIMGTVERVEGHKLIVRSENTKKQAEVTYKKDKIIITGMDLLNPPEPKQGSLEEIRIGDEVRLGEINVGDNGELSANVLLIMR